MICRNHVDVSEGVRRCTRCGSSFCSDCLVDIGGKPYCATCKTEELLDVRSGIERGTLDLASIGRRFGASFIDGLLMWIPIAVMGTLLLLAVVFSDFSLEPVAFGTPGPMLNWVKKRYGVTPG